MKKSKCHKDGDWILHRHPTEKNIMHKKCGKRQPPTWNILKNGHPDEQKWWNSWNSDKNHHKSAVEGSTHHEESCKSKTPQPKCHLPHSPRKKEGLFCWDYEALSNSQQQRPYKSKTLLLWPCYYKPNNKGHCPLIKKWVGLLRPSNTSKTVAVFTCKLGVLDGWMALTVWKICVFFSGS